MSKFDFHPVRSRFFGFFASSAIIIIGSSFFTELGYGEVPSLAATANAKPESATDIVALDSCAEGGEITVPAGAPVEHIVIKPLNIFDLEDPREDNFLYRLANKLHIMTKPYVIKQQLLIEEGMPADKELIDESARILRTNVYFYDANICARLNNNDKVDLDVVTKDVWSLEPGFNYGRKGGKNSTSLELDEKNLLGTGVALHVGHKTTVDRSSNTFIFEDDHVGGSWLGLTTHYEDSSDGKSYGLTVGQPFYSLGTTSAWGVSFEKSSTVDSFYDRGLKLDSYAHDKKTVRLFKGWSQGLSNGSTQRWKLGVALENNTFDPLAGTKNLAWVPQDRKFTYPFLQYEYLEDQYAKKRNQDEIGRTEDVYLGKSLNVEIGYAPESFGSSRDSLLFSANYAYGLELSKKKLWLFTGNTHTRFENGAFRNAWTEGKVRYYRRQSRKSLTLFSLAAGAGHSLDLDQQALLGGDSGLRGYPLRYSRGNGYTLLTIEQRYFTDWQPFRLFQIGGAAFFDMGRTWGGNISGMGNPGWLKDIGIGLRVGNKKTAFGNVLHIDFAFPLDGGSSISKMQVEVSTQKTF